VVARPMHHCNLAPHTDCESASNFAFANMPNWGRSCMNTNRAGKSNAVFLS